MYKITLNSYIFFNDNIPAIAIDWGSNTGTNPWNRAKLVGRGDWSSNRLREEILQKGELLAAAKIEEAMRHREKPSNYPANL